MHTGETLLPKIHFWWIDIHVSEIKWKTGHLLELFHLYIFKITQQTSKINNYNNFSKLTKLSLLLSRTICFDSFLFTWEREQTSTCYKENETYRLILSLCLTDKFNLQLLSPRPWRSFLLFLFFLCALDLYRCFHWKETITHSINSLNTDDEEVLTTGNYNCAYFALIRPISIAQRTVSHSSRCSRMGSQKEQIFILCTASLFLSRGISYHRLKMSSGKKKTHGENDARCWVTANRRWHIIGWLFHLFVLKEENKTLKNVFSDYHCFWTKTQKQLLDC